MMDPDCTDCRCSSSAVIAAGGCPHREPVSQDDIDEAMQDIAAEIDVDEFDHLKALDGAEWAFVWTGITLAAIGLAALAGWAWRAWPWW